MRDRIRTLAIRLLFRLVDPVSDRNDHIATWLAMSWEHPGFKAYVAERDTRLIRGLVGDSLAVPPRDKAHQVAGQRVELLRLAHRAKLAYEERRKKLINTTQ